MKELQERESRGETVKGTNLSPEELGFNLVDKRAVLNCQACVRYIPIKETEAEEDTKTKHCMTFSHIKYVDEYNERERKHKEKKARDEERKLAAAAAAVAASKTEDDEDKNTKSDDSKATEDNMDTTVANTNVNDSGEQNEVEQKENVENLEEEREVKPRVSLVNNNNN